MFFLCFWITLLQSLPINIKWLYSAFICKKWITLLLIKCFQTSFFYLVFESRSQKADALQTGNIFRNCLACMLRKMNFFYIFILWKFMSSFRHLDTCNFIFFCFLSFLWHFPKIINLLIMSIYLFIRTTVIIFFKCKEI